MMPTLKTLMQRVALWLAAVSAVDVGRPRDGLVPLATAGTPLDKPWPQLSGELGDALEAWRHNPLARRLVGLTTAYVVGDGIRISSNRPALARWLARFLADPDSQVLIQQAEWCDELARSGELFLALFTGLDGRVAVRAVPASRIERVECQPGDYGRELRYVQVQDYAGAAPGGEGAAGDEPRVWLSPWAARQAGARPASGRDRLPAPIMLHYAVNRPVGCLRGESDLKPILPWLRRYSRWLEDRVALNAASRAFLWLVRVPASQVAQKAERYRRPPDSSSVVVVDRDAEDWQAVAPDLSARDAESDGRALRWMVAAGGPGTGLVDLGEAETSNLATAEAMGEQRRRFLRRRQAYFAHVLADLCVWAHNWPIELGLRRGRPIREADLVVDAPDIAPADNQVLAAAAREIIAAVSALQALTGDSPALRRLAVRLLLKFAGESVNDDDFAQLTAEQSV